MKLIGMTEAGDAGRDLTWYDKLIKDDNYVGAILITKYGHRPEFQDKALDLLLNHKPCIIHFGCTGWGNTPMEPGNPTPETLLRSIRAFIDRGFPAKNCVLRIDPIIPTTEGIARAKDTLRLAAEIIPDITRIRIRISIYDDYHCSREEMIRRGYPPIDNITKWKSEQERRPTPIQVRTVAQSLLSVVDPAGFSG